jgi:hypothetical protein
VRVRGPTRVRTAPPVAALTAGFILLFWAPLAAQWLMMAAESPFLAAVIARLGDPAFNLAAYGVAYAIAILVESPVIMLMSASIALVEDRASYLRLRAFTRVLNAGSTALLVLVLLPPVAGFLFGTVLGLPEEVARLAYGALWILLPWPAAIGYRRFLHGVLIRAGRTRLVAYGTVLRLGTMVGTAVVLFMYGGLPGTWVGAAALSAGVVIEAAAARFMVRDVLRGLMAGGRLEDGTLVEATNARGEEVELTFPDIARFYYPLALTSFIGLTVQPLLVFFMGRSVAPIESLAVFPVVAALAFIFRSLGLSYQEAVIALLGTENEHFGPLARFGAGLGLGASAALALVAFTPLADLWFIPVSGLTPELATFAITPVKIAAVLPVLSVLLALQRGVLVRRRTTHPITAATVIEVIGIAILFPLFAWGIGMVGVTAAFLAFLGGRLAGNLFLIRPSRQALRS